MVEANKILYKTRMLHVDDDELQLLMVKEFFKYEDSNIEVISTNDPLNALETIKEQNFDCLVLDYSMPDINGVELAKLIRKISDIPIILYTGQGSEEVAEIALSVGIDDYIRKEMGPGHYKLLLNKIYKSVDKYKTNLLHNEIVRSINEAILIIENDNIVFFNGVFNELFIKDNGTNIKKINEIFRGKNNKFIKWLKDESNNCELTFNINGRNIICEVDKIKINLFDDSRLIVFRDVTTRKMLEDEREMAIKRFTSLVELSPDAIASASLKGYVTYVNPAFSMISGFPKEEILGKHMTRLGTLSNKNLIPYLKLFKQVVTGEKVEPVNFTYNKKDGTNASGEAFIDLIELGGKKEVISIIRDTTSKLVQEEIYKNILNTSPDSIIYFDSNGNITFINESGLKLFNVKKGDLIGKNILDELRLVKDKLNISIDVEKLIYGKLNPFEIKLEDDLTIKWLEIISIPIEYNNDILGSQLIIKDVTETKNRDFIKQKQIDDLEDLIKEKTKEILDNERIVVMGKLASMIAHDMKAPLQVIKNSFYLMDMHPENVDEYKKYVERALENISELLDDFRQNNTTPSLNLAEANLSTLIEESLMQVQTSENISIEKSISDSIKITADAPKLKRVFDNLIKNAIEAMPDGGTVKILSEESEDYEIIKIKDTGRGIKQENMDKLFKPFYTTKSNGMGLGLAYCFKTVKSHGGEISVESEYLKGTTFIVKLPKKQEIGQYPLQLKEVYANQITQQ